MAKRQAALSCVLRSSETQIEVVALTGSMMFYNVHQERKVLCGSFDSKAINLWLGPTVCGACSLCVHGFPLRSITPVQTRKSATPTSHQGFTRCGAQPFKIRVENLAPRPRHVYRDEASGESV
jgi:hypothetical protein